MRSLIRRSRFARIAAGHPDEGSGLILVFVVMLISSALSLVLLESAVSMAKQTAGNNKRVTSLAAAQAGLDSALGQIRDATNAITGEGDVASIPCTVTAGGVGGVGATRNEGSATGSYTVRVAYFAVDPSAQTAAWRANSANQINCPNGSHPDKVPSYALVTATGASSAGKPRTVESTYIFTNSNKNIAGGLLHVQGGGEGTTPDLCPDAGSAHPSIGDVVTMQPCDKQDQGQLWSYQTDLSFLLTSTTNDQAPKYPMCMNVAGSPAAKGTVITMAICTGQPTLPTATIQQQFSYDDNGFFENTKPKTGSPTGTLAGTCWVVTNANTSGSTININNCGTAWRPEASVGAGMSGDGINVGLATQQLVNYAEFGRCLDATGANPDAAYMIAYPCKQSPTATEILWNQKYGYSGSPTTYGTLSTLDTANGKTYCLTSPMSAESNPLVVGPFVTLQVCPSTIPNSMKWHEIGASSGDYTTEYTIQDMSVPPLCLGVGQPGGGTRTVSGLGEWSTPYVQVCDGSLIQKWNAPPNVPVGTVTDTHEVGTGG